MGIHALLSASASSRWLNCTPSVRLEETLPEITSEYAIEGSMAHEIAELRLLKHFLEPMSPRTFNSRLKKIQSNPLYAGVYKDEMLKYTEMYLDHIAKIALDCRTKPYVAVEKKIDYSTYAPEGFGTCDCIMLSEKTAYVIDFKYGKGVPVSAENNSQMMLYALGALSAYSVLYDIATIKMVIIQPRLDNISEFEMSAEVLKQWGENIRPIAKQAFEGSGEFVSGKHCRFCKAKAQCRARAVTNLSLEEFSMKIPPLLSNREVGEILRRAENLKNWIDTLQEYALSEVLAGNEIDGWKAVNGRSIRLFTDIEKAFEKLKNNGVEEAMLYEKNPISLAAIEKLLGKNKFEELLSELIVKPPGKATLVTETDKREAIRNKTTAEEAFKNI